MWALGFATIGRMLCENGNQFVCSDFFTGKFSPKSQLEKNMISSHKK
jgi:hypothetical protein